MDSLQGHFLISTPQMPDPRFRERVIFICGHSDEGAVGLVINQPIPNTSVADVLVNAGIKLPPGIILPPIYMGGPVEVETAFFLYVADYQAPDQIRVTGSVSLSSDPQIMRDIAAGTGPSQYLFLLGYAGWAPGQLENELTDNGWLTLPAEDAVLFETPDELKWKRAAERFGINIATFGEVMGTA